MSLKRRALSAPLGLVTLSICTSAALGQESNRPVDQPFAISAEEMERVNAAIEPFSEMGRRTFPQAKDRFIGGLPNGHAFFVTADIRDSSGRTEQVFVYVTSVQDRIVSGNIASDILFVDGYEYGDPLEIPESGIKDWTIASPDGAEEGNFVGRFMDHYAPGRVLVAIFGFTVTGSGVAQDIRVVSIVNDLGDAINVDLPPDWIEAARTRILEDRTSPSVEEVFVPLIYDPDRPIEPVSIEQYGNE